MLIGSHIIFRLLARTRARLFQALVQYLAQPAKKSLPEAVSDESSLIGMLEPGDVLLTEGSTRMAALVRRATKSTWAHVSIYVGPLSSGPDPCCVVEADVAAGVRAVPLSEFDGQRVRVLRPKELPVALRGTLAAWVVGRIGNGYDLGHALTLASRLLRVPWISWERPAPRSDVAQGTTGFVCSSLLAQAFLWVGYPIVPMQDRVGGGAAADHRYLTPRDFESASIFEVVRSTRSVCLPLRNTAKPESAPNDFEIHRKAA